MIIILKEFLMRFLEKENVALGLSIALITSCILLLCYGVDYCARTYLVKLLKIAISKLSLNWGTALLKYRVIHRFSYFASAIFIYLSSNIYDISDIPATETLVFIIKKISLATMIVIAALVTESAINSVEYVYNTYKISKKRPIKSYLQVLKLLFIIIAIVLVISTILDKSPLVFLTGLGALMTIIILIFKDSILGFVASIQLTTYDMVRIGDWISLPSFGADGDVIDISLNTVKVRNFDNTITTVPTYALMTNGVKNWRGMQESGGRRIKKYITLDMKTIKFCSDELINKLKKIHLISDYMSNKLKEIEESNFQINRHGLKINGRSLTNIGCYRAYINAFLRNKSKHVHQSGHTFLVRQLQLSDTGLPLEIYIFSKSTNWVKYEELQSDIMDHLLAVVPIFELEVFQRSTSLRKC